MSVGLLYDPICLEHNTGDHPEDAGRLREIVACLQGVGLWDELPHLEFGPATMEDILACHDESYIASIEWKCARGIQLLTPDTVISPRSYEAAQMGAGAAVRAVEAVVGGEVDQAFALMRPPGHHATPNVGMGFCLINSAAVAARAAVRRLGIKRVLLMDFDVHHGNGTQDIFYTDPSVLYFSTHQSPAYPGTGLLEETGAADGYGTTVNVPLPAGLGDEGFLMAFDQVLAPVAEWYHPELIVVSAGYDAHWTNFRYLSSIQMQATVNGFAGMVERLRRLAETHCGGRMALVLEGGYDHEALARSVEATLNVLLDRPVEDSIGPSQYPRPEPNIRSILNAARRVHRLD